MIYLDNAATTKPSEAALGAMCAAAEHFGNPSSLYGIGLEAEKMINEAKKIIADKLGINAGQIYFTSGGTEANNTAVFGAARAAAKTGKRLVTAKIEHPSVLEAFKRLEEEGFEVIYLGAQRDGRINIKELEESLTEDTTLVSVMHVNNETGVIQPVDEIKKLMKIKSPRALFHCDCVQSFGKIPVEPKKWGADMISVSAHKIHGFKGTGALCILNGRIRPLLCGGEQQSRIRPGTENVGGILAFGAAVRESEYCGDYLRGLRAEMESLLRERIDNIVINGSDEYNSGSVLNVSILGAKAEIMLHSLEARGICVSTGSACSSRRPHNSHVLTAMGADKGEIESALRLSFCAGTTREDICAAARAIAEEAAVIRRVMR